MREQHTQNADAGYERRRLLRWAGAFGAAALAGCSGQSGSGQTDQSTQTAQTESSGTTSGGSGDSDSQEDESTPSPTPSKRMGGELRLGVGRNPETINPIETSNFPEYMYTSWTYSNLTIVNEDFEVVPELAKDWERNSDATQWTFNLRSDATFHHNGKQVTASDVAATFRKTQVKEVGSVAKGILGPVDSFEAVDETTFRINLKKPFLSTPLQLTIPQFRILPEAVVTNDDKYKQATTQEFGSGPFVQEKYQPGNVLSATRYEDYFETDENGVQLPYLDRVVQNSYPDASSKMSAFGNGTIDVNPLVSASNWSRLQGMDAESIRKPGTSWANIVMRCDTEPFSDPKVRKAFRIAVDREAMLQGARSGLGTVSQDNLIPPSFPQHVEMDSLGPRRQRARELLAEAGYPDGLDLTSDEFDADLTLFAANSPAVRVPLAVQLQEQLKEIGVKFDIQQTSYDTYLSNVWSSAPFYVGFYITRAVPVATYNLLLVSDASWNESQWNNEEFDEVVADIQSATSKETQMEGYRKAQRLMYEEGPYLIPFVQDALAANKKYVRGYHKDVTGSYPAGLTENIWVDSGSPTKN